MTVLVVDVGGGTSDFTLIRVAREGDRVEFTRTAVGRHLLLGGDNLDLTLAWLVETKLRCRSRSASAAASAANAPTPRSACSTPQSEKRRNHRTGHRLRAHRQSARRLEVLREEALELALDGFLPLTAPGHAHRGEEPLPRAGLPYVSDPAVTKHLNAFLDSAGQAPDAILFNGGFFIPEILRQRVADAVGNWYGKRPEVFENRDLDLAVATGAAYYSYVRSTGSGVLVRGGLPRTYFIGIGDTTAVCLVPRGAEEGATLEIDNEALQLVANKPVSFRLYSSLTRSEDKLGDVVESPRARPRSAHARAAQRRHPLRQEGRRAAHPRETRRTPHRDRHARNLVRIEDQRESLALAIRAA